MKLSNETKIGIFVTVVIVSLGILTVKTGNFNINKKGYELKVVFKSIDGIDVNAPVMLNGFEVGAVKDIIISETDEETKMELIVWLEERARLRGGAKAYVKNMGFMGEKYVGLTSGDKGAVVLEPGAVIIGQEPADLDKLLLDGQEIATNIKEVAQNVNERLKKNKDAIDASIAHLHSITANIDERLTVNKDHIDEIMLNLRNTSINLDQLTYDLKTHPWKIMYRSREKRQESIDLLKQDNETK